jgi:osmotically-inducible protein OsmY
MLRPLCFAVVVIAASAACGADTATQERVPEPMTHLEPRADAPAVGLVPESSADRAIRRDLTLAISQDAELKHRDISFTITNGDVSVTGAVRTEDERKRINDLAMNIGGVKSVANALRVEE